MKKRTSTAAALMLTAAMAASACAMSVSSLTAFAEETNKKMSVGSVENDQATHKFLAYQVFTGKLATINEKKQLVEIKWANEATGADLLKAIKAFSADGGTTKPFADCTSAAAVAAVLEGFQTDSAEANAFADLMDANAALLAEPVELVATEGKEVTVPAPGYYFIKDTISKTPDDGKQYAYSDHIMKVMTDGDLLNITAKADVPTIDKKIGEDYDTGVKANQVSIGDKVPYVLQTKVPNMSKYNDYYFIIQDDLCDGLTFNNDVTITIGATDLKKEDFTVVTATTDEPLGGYDFKIVFKDFYENYKEKANDVITVKYSATLNEKADLTNAGNPNDVDLTFSNNPNHKYDGGDEPSEDEKKSGDDVIGVTPKSQVRTFTTGLKLVKIDAVTKKALKGAKFSIKGDGVKAVLINGKIYKEDAEGTYYMLKDGTFTKEEPNEETTKLYDKAAKKYAEITTVGETTAAATNSVNQEAYSDANGIITFAGLGAGTYTIKEEEAPEGGYNKLEDPIEITIAANFTDANNSTDAPTWTVKNADDILAPDDNLYKFEVENNKGTTLPETGGIGTVLFYIIGSSLIVGAFVLMALRKRAAKEEK